MQFVSPDSHPSPAPVTLQDSTPRPWLFAIWNRETAEFQIGGFEILNAALSGAFQFTHAKNIPADTCPDELRKEFAAIGFVEAAWQVVLPN
jgi:hypothetical protein